MNIDTRFLLQALRFAYNQTSPTTLRGRLQAKADAQFTVISSGGIRATSANGQRVEFDFGGDQPNPSDILSAWVYLVDLFDTAYGALGGTPADTAVEKKMETYLRPVTGYTDNFMYLQK